MERIVLEPRAMVAAPRELELQASERISTHPARIERLFVEHYRFVWRTLRRLGVHEEATDDCAQHVFLIASTRLGDVANDKERAFLVGVAVRVAANARRSQARRREEPDCDAVAEHATATSPEELLDWKQRRVKLDRWLEALSLELRAPFVLFELEGMALDEIAAVLELPLGTVKTRLRRARAIFMQAAAGEVRP